MLPQCYEIVIKDNDLAIVDKIDYETYKNLEKHFECVYNTKKGESYPLDKDLELCGDMLVADNDHLCDLLNDLLDQGFCETVQFNFIEDYFYGNYEQYIKAF